MSDFDIEQCKFYLVINLECTIINFYKYFTKQFISFLIVNILIFCNL